MPGAVLGTCLNFFSSITMSSLHALTPLEDSDPELQRLQQELEECHRVKSAEKKATAEAKAQKAAEEVAWKQKVEEETAKKSTEKKRPQEDDLESEVEEVGWVLAW